MMNNSRQITFDRIINLATSVILGALLSTCLVTFILLERYLQGVHIEILTFGNLSIFIVTVVVLSVVFRKYALADH